MERKDLVEELERIARDDKLNIESFLDRVEISLESNGIEFTSEVYGLPVVFLSKIEERRTQNG